MFLFFHMLNKLCLYHIALKMKNILEKASGYSGDANSLQIIEMPNKFMQFHNK